MYNLHVHVQTCVRVCMFLLPQVPLGLIECLEMQASKDSFSVVCKDARAFRWETVALCSCIASVHESVDG